MVVLGGGAVSYERGTPIMQVAAFVMESTMHGAENNLASCKNKLAVGSEEGSYLRLIDFCITQLYAQEWERRRTEID